MLVKELLMDNDKLQRRKDSLTEKHRALDKQIESMYRSYKPAEEVKALKQQKLKLKTEIQSITKQLGDDDG